MQSCLNPDVRPSPRDHIAYPVSRLCASRALTEHKYLSLTKFCSLVASFSLLCYCTISWVHTLSISDSATTEDPIRFVCFGFSISLWISEWQRISCWTPILSSHNTCCVSRDRWVEDRNNYIFGIFDRDLPIHFTTFMRTSSEVEFVYSGNQKCSKFSDQCVW